MKGGEDMMDGMIGSTGKDLKLGSGARESMASNEFFDGWSNNF